MSGISGDGDQNDKLVGGTDETVIGNKGDRLNTALVGGTGLAADVDLSAGKNRLATDAQVTVNQVLGQDQFADVWVAVGTLADCAGVGGIGDTVRIEIGVGCDATLFPAVDVTSTITATETGAANPEIALADLIIADLTADADFALNFKAKRNQSNSTVFITSKIIGEFGERPATDDFKVTTTGTTVMTRGFDNILRRSKQTSISSDPRDPRVGTLGISGTVSILPGTIENTFEDLALNGASSDMTVNGSVTPVIFKVDADPVLSTLVTEIRLYAQDNGIKLAKFLGQNTALAAGVEIKITSLGETRTLPLIKTTADFKHKLSIPVTNWVLDVESAQDDAIGAREFSNPIMLEAGSSDKIEIKIQDDLSSVMLFEALIIGFRQEV